MEEYGSTLDALAQFMGRPAALEAEAKRLGYPIAKLSHMVFATHIAVSLLAGGAQKTHAYELAADSMEISPTTISNYISAFRASSYTLHCNGERRPKPHV